MLAQISRTLRSPRVPQTITIPTLLRSAENSHPNRLRFVDLQLFTLSSLFKMYALSSISNPLRSPGSYSDHRLADARDALAFDDSPYSGSLSLHQQVLINSSPPSTSALSGSLPQPSTTPTALGSPFTLASFRQPSAAPDNPASLSTAFGSLRSLQQPSAVSASLRSLTFDITFTPQCKTQTKRYGINDFVDMLKTSN